MSNSLQLHGLQPIRSMRFPRQEYWSGLPFPTPRIFLTQGWNRISWTGWWLLYHWAAKEVLFLFAAKGDPPPPPPSPTSRLHVRKLKVKVSHVRLSWNSLGQTTGVGSHFLFQGIFPTQGSNPGLLHCRQILYQMSHKGSPRIRGWVAYPFSRGIFPTQESNQGLLALQVDS